MAQAVHVTVELAPTPPPRYVFALEAPAYVLMDLAELDGVAIFSEPDLRGRLTAVAMIATEAHQAPLLPLRRYGGEVRQMEENMQWLQRKCQAQRDALRSLNRRVVAQRAVLRRLAELGMVLAAEQWSELRHAGLDEEALSEDVRQEAPASV
ncbi:MAG: hypothetical protein ACRDY0_06640 [Acidimicrobiales bacterium]